MKTQNNVGVTKATKEIDKELGFIDNPFQVIGQSIKEKVKRGEISARDGFTLLITEAQANGGANGVAVFRGSKSAGWLSRRIRGN